MKSSSERRVKRLEMEHRLLLMFSLLTVPAFAVDVRNNEKNHTHDIRTKDSRGPFSPRMDYDRWKPLGRGDPLQNDPTYDYVPPVLDRVHYWMEPTTGSPASPPARDRKKSEILVLGVSSKKPSSTATAEGRRDPHGSLLKFIDGPKAPPRHDPFGRPDGGRRSSLSTSHTFRPQYFKNKFDDPQRPDDRRTPHTVLVPPPPDAESPAFDSRNASPNRLRPATGRPVYGPSTTTMTTSPPRTSVSVREADLAYHSSGTNGDDRWRRGHDRYSSATFVPRRTPTDGPPLHNFFQEAATDGNFIVFPKNSTEDDGHEYKIYHGERSELSNLPVAFPTETPGNVIFEQAAYGPFALENSVHGSQSSDSYANAYQSLDRPVNTKLFSDAAVHVLRVDGDRPAVTRMSVDGRPMRRGQVSDDTVGDTYVNIGKPDAHIQKEITTDGSPDLNTRRPSSVLNANGGGASMAKPVVQTTTSPHVHSDNDKNSIYTTRRPSHDMIDSGISPDRRPGPVTEEMTLEIMQTMRPPPISTATEKIAPSIEKPTASLHALLQKEITSATFETPAAPYTAHVTTAATAAAPGISSMTTDPLFKHYKQPKEPIRGPMYLIIQGHSKVKTYGASHRGAVRDISGSEANEIPQNGDIFAVKRVPKKIDIYEKDVDEEEINHRTTGARTWKDPVERNIGNMFTREAELGAKYEVEEGTTTTERYHRGIVESEKIQTGDRITSDPIKSRKRQKRQLEDFLPVVEDAVETYLYDYLKKKSEGSGIGAVVASAITSDGADDYVNGLGGPFEDDGDEEENEEGERDENEA